MSEQNVTKLNRSNITLTEVMTLLCGDHSQSLHPALKRRHQCYQRHFHQNLTSFEKKLFFRTEGSSVEIMLYIIEKEKSEGIKSEEYRRCGGCAVILRELSL
jgi:hypothetical protein